MNPRSSGVIEAITHLSTPEEVFGNFPEQDKQARFLQKPGVATREWEGNRSLWGLCVPSFGETHSRPVF